MNNEGSISCWSAARWTFVVFGVALLIMFLANSPETSPQTGLPIVAAE